MAPWGFPSPRACRLVATWVRAFASTGVRIGLYPSMKRALGGKADSRGSLPAIQVASGALTGMVRLTVLCGRSTSKLPGLDSHCDSWQELSTTAMLLPRSVRRLRRQRIWCGCGCRGRQADSVRTGATRQGYEQATGRASARRQMHSPPSPEWKGCAKVRSCTPPARQRRAYWA
jgi:hypothetical protein